MRSAYLKKNSVALLFWLLFPAILFSQSLHLIPVPQQVVRGEGVFLLASEKLLYITDADDTTLLFPANLFIREVKKDVGFEPDYTLEAKKAAILMGYRGQDKKFDKLTASFVAALDTLGDEGYILQVTPQHILLVANKDAGLFYGVMTLNQLLRGNRQGPALPALTITDKPALRYRAWQDDISRGPIPTLAFLKEEVRRMAALKMNAFTLYTEHVFKLKSHPGIAPADGITADEIRELSQYAKKYHIELVGNFQAFGHFRHILEKPEYSHLAETPNVISPAFEESYQLLEDILGEIARAYDSKLFIINCDEVFGLGSGPAKTMVDTMGLPGVYAYHINRIAAILKKYGKRPMMWGDIAKKYPAIIPLLPDSIIVLPWAYHAAPSFRDYIEPFAQDSLEYWVCPGVSCWNRIFPDLRRAGVNISHFVRDGYALGAAGMLNTTWDDDGENFFNYNWFPLAWGAECAWHPVTGSDTAMQKRFERFRDAWDPLVYGSRAGVARLLLQLDSLRDNAAADGLYDKAFWSPLIDEGYDARNTSRLLNEALALEKGAAAVLRGLEQVRSQGQDRGMTLDYVAFAARRTLFLARKNTMHYRLNDPQERRLLDAGRVRRSLQGLAASLTELKKEYARLWKEENRPWWLDKNLEKYDRLISDLHNTPYHLFIVADDSVFAPVRTVTITPLFPAGEIRYTLDGSPPDTSSLLYQGPFAIDTTTLVRASVVEQGELRPVFGKKITVYRGPVKNISLKHPWGKQYPGGGLQGLVDGVRGSENYNDGRWMGFIGDDLVAVIELKEPADIDTLSAGFLQQRRSWILFPEYVEVAVSADGKEWTNVCREMNHIPQEKNGTFLQTFTCPLSARGVKYLRVTAKNTGTLPAWHPSAGKEAWIFVDEIKVKEVKKVEEVEESKS